MRAKVLIGFYDIECGCDRLPGDEFEASAERIAEIGSKLEGYVAAVPVPVPEPEPAKRRTAAKKAPVSR